MKQDQHLNAFRPAHLTPDVQHEEDREQSRVAFQRDIISILTQLITLPLDETVSGIEKALRSIGEFFQADRSYFIFTSDRGKTIEDTYEWCADGTERQIKDLNGFLLEIFGWEWDIFTRLEPLSIPHVADLPPKTFLEKRVFQTLGIQSFALIPLAIEGVCIGLLGLDSIRSERDWIRKDLELLKGTGEAIVNILAHRRGDAALKDTLQRIERIKKEWESTVDSLSELVFLIDNRGFVIRSNRAIESWRLGSVLNVRGRTIHEILHPGCVNPQCVFIALLPRVWEKLNQNRTIRWEFPDRILKRYLSVQMRPILIRVEGKTELSCAVVAINNITQPKIRERDRDKLVHELQHSVSKSGRLSGLLPICCSCKRIRDKAGRWNHIEVYIRDHSEADFTHGICPECRKKLYPELK
ncbi:MAG TPA: GAF domain-containing protein [Thermodesulfobacteriota bacterium]|nr:GAF domain-containing protein [Thermodesulfobacteriota bacterium]